MPPRCPEHFMLGFSKTTVALSSVTASTPGDRDADVYDRHAAGLYRQALLTLDDPGMAEQVVSDVIVGECVRSSAPAHPLGDPRRHP
jgi:hypothetical protein